MKLYETFDYLVWLLSDRSLWLPPDLRAILLQGMKEWTVWPWLPKDREPAFFHELHTAAEEEREFEWSEVVERDLATATSDSKRTLALPETVPDLITRFVAARCIESYIDERRERRRRHVNRSGA